jgi:hypothetical protein
LNIALSGTNVLLSWPTPPGDVVLQQNFDLTTTNWTTVTNPPAVMNGQNQVVLPSGSSNQFYRIEYP